MPIDWQPVELGASLPACRAVVATRLHAPDREAAILRRLRVLNFSGLMLDDPEVIERAGTEALIDPEEILVWTSDPAVEPAEPSVGSLAKYGNVRMVRRHRRTDNPRADEPKRLSPSRG
jgi:hypothetical protein